MKLCQATAVLSCGLGEKLAKLYLRKMAITWFTSATASCTFRFSSGCYQRTPLTLAVSDWPDRRSSSSAMSSLSKVGLGVASFRRWCMPCIVSASQSCTRAYRSSCCWLTSSSAPASAGLTTPCPTSSTYPQVSDGQQATRQHDLRAIRRFVLRCQKVVSRDIGSRGFSAV